MNGVTNELLKASGTPSSKTKIALDTETIRSEANAPVDTMEVLALKADDVSDVLSPGGIGFFNGDPTTTRLWLREADSIYHLHKSVRYQTRFVQLLPFCLTGLARRWYFNLIQQQGDNWNWMKWKYNILKDFDLPLEIREKAFASRRWNIGQEDIGDYYIDKISLFYSAYADINAERTMTPNDGDNSNHRYSVQSHAASSISSMNNKNVAFIESKIKAEVRHQAKLDIGWTFREPTEEFGTLWYLRQIQYQYETKGKRRSVVQSK
ncbi:unnamed protein product [Sympodiomycopsis kandeliae]